MDEDHDDHEIDVPDDGPPRPPHSQCCNSHGHQIPTYGEYRRRQLIPKRKGGKQLMNEYHQRRQNQRMMYREEEEDRQDLFARTGMDKAKRDLKWRAKWEERQARKRERERENELDSRDEGRVKRVDMKDIEREDKEQKELQEKLKPQAAPIYHYYSSTMP